MRLDSSIRTETSQLWEIYQHLLEAYGRQRWWPADSDFEVVVGAFLTQNTSWKNVEKAIIRLKEADALTAARIYQLDPDELAELIRPSGCFRQKARRLKGFTAHLFERHGGSLEHLFDQEVVALRQELLSLNGVGPETADSIVLYAARQPIFVVDKYTRRLFDRVGLLHQPDYAAVQTFCHAALPGEAALFNEYHALIVRHSIAHCLARPRCFGCPLRAVCATGQTEPASPTPVR